MIKVKRNEQTLQTVWVSKPSQKLPDSNVVNAKELEIRGITNFQQAMLLAYRALNKIKYQKRSVEFDAYHEAYLITRNDLILVADDTRSMLISSGSVFEQDGLYLKFVPTLSAHTR